MTATLQKWSVFHITYNPQSKKDFRSYSFWYYWPINDSITNKRFIISFIDEFSRKSWLFLIRSKSEAPDIIINFLKQLNNIIDNYKIRYFKSDNGREYDNKKVKNFCKDNGIEKIYSPPYNPENNGLTERYNQTIISSTKTILFWSKLSDNFWDFAIQYSNYIYNKISHSGIGNKIPDEVFYNKKANINHIKVFGCVTYYKNKINKSSNQILIKVYF